MSYIVFAWLTSISYGVGSILGKIATRYHIDNPWLYNFVWGVFTLVFIVPFALYYHVGLPQDWNSMLWLSLANAVSGTLFVLAFFAVDLSVLSPLVILRVPMTALVGVLAYHESLGSYQWILIGIIFLAGIFVNVDEKFSLRALFSKKILLGLVWIVASTWFNSMIKYASLTNGFWEVSLWSNILGFILILTTWPLFSHDLFHTSCAKYKGIGLSSLLFTIGLLFSVKAFGENVSISTAIISLPLAMLFTIVLSFVSPKLLEKHANRVYAIRLAAAFAMFAAALGLSK